MTENAIELSRGSRSSSRNRIMWYYKRRYSEL